MENLVALNKTTAGRDKIYRVVQYFSRFYGWVLSENGTSLQISRPIKSLEKHISLARKLMRVMKCIDHYLDTLHFWKDSSASDSEFDRLLRVLTSAGKSLRMASSDFQWASALRLFGNYSERIHASANKASDLFWLISLCTSLIHSYRRQHAMKHQINVLHSEYKGLQQASKLLRKRIAEQQEEKEKDTTINTSTSLSDEGLSDKTRTPIQLESSSAVTSLPDMKELEAQLLREEQQMHALKRQCYALRDQVVATILDMVREICDIPVPAFSLGLLHPSTTGMVGLSGTISSIIGLYQVWTRVVSAKTTPKMCK